MRNLRNRNRDLLINELNQGKELANQLRFYLSPSCPNGEVLIRQLQSSLNKAIAMLNCNQAEAAEAETKLQDIVKESLRLVSGSPQSHVSEYKDICRKRKILPQWTEQVRGSSEMGLEEPEDDGYGWRKYGQKDILGAKYLRGYYRCTHRNAHGCMATKQVQRSNKNPLIFDITYRGKHTCIQAHLISPTSELPIKQEQRQGSKKARHSEEIFINFAADPKDITSNFNTYQISTFSFPSTLSMETKLKNKNVSSFHPDKNTMDNCSRQFMSPTSSETNYLSPSPMNNSFGSASIFTNSDCSPTSSSKFSRDKFVTRCLVLSYIHRIFLEIYENFDFNFSPRYIFVSRGSSRVIV